MEDRRDGVVASVVGPSPGGDLADPRRSFHASEDEHVAARTAPQGQPGSQDSQPGRLVLDGFVPWRPVDRVAIEEAPRRGQHATRQLTDDEVPGVAESDMVRLRCPAEATLDRDELVVQEVEQWDRPNPQRVGRAMAVDDRPDIAQRD